ncbi:MAG: SDR family oxidoreductase [Chlorobaculum sp.]|nr:SDR family oxidoreductase [Chlorobaculum sp.]
MKHLEGKNAIVTGGTRGIGRAVSLALAESGATVFALYARSRKNAESLEKEAADKGLRIIAIRGDLAHDETFDEVLLRLRAECPVVDVLVHSAASGVHRKAMSLSDRHLKWTFEINFFAVHRLTRELRERMKSGSRIIGITSPGGTRVIPDYAAVASTKGAMEALFRHYAQELAPEGISVNLVCPGLVMTDVATSVPELGRLLEITRDYTPSGRLTTPEDVAETIRFLTTEGARQIVGQTIVIDGGKGLMA